MHTRLTGHLLAATPTLLDPNFRRAVVLIVEHADDGTLGVVLNRPSDVHVKGILPEWDLVAARPPVVFVGGPVHQQSILGLGRLGEPSTVVGGTRLALLDLDRAPADVGADAARIFAGYAGWAPGQVEAEIASGSWFVVSGSDEDAFCPEPGALWLSVVRRQGGMYEAFPLDPSLN